jgi:hypothetical protein
MYRGPKCGQDRPCVRTTTCEDQNLRREMDSENLRREMDPGPRALASLATCCRGGRGRGGRGTRGRTRAGRGAAAGGAPAPLRQGRRGGGCHARGRERDACHAARTRRQRAQRHAGGVSRHVGRHVPRLPREPARRPHTVSPRPSRARCTLRLARGRISRSRPRGGWHPPACGPARPSPCWPAGTNR